MVMGRYDWSEIERLCAEAVHLERADASETELRAIYDRLQEKLRPIALSMAREAVGDAQRAAEVVDNVFEYLPLLVVRYTIHETPCEK